MTHYQIALQNMSTIGKPYVEKLLTPYNEFPYWETLTNPKTQVELIMYTISQYPTKHEQLEWIQHIFGKIGMTALITQELYNINEEYFYIHYTHLAQYKIEFIAYPVYKCTNVNREIEYLYTNKHDCNILDPFEEELVLSRFEGSYVWRGCWESRIYFTDDEYWGEELDTMTQLFTKIEEYCKSHITQ